MTSVENDPFYLRYYVGHSGKHGHEFLEFEYANGRLRYANNSNYRNESLIRKESEHVVLSRYSREAEQTFVSVDQPTDGPRAEADR
ncbi:hypothetical protein FRC03_002665 [Tulasnella sp. 419]|nr:hypothetical protein FRC03_002665 [Tulasnella sp. 419]